MDKLDRPGGDPNIIFPTRARPVPGLVASIPAFFASRIVILPDELRGDSDGDLKSPEVEGEFVPLPDRLPV